MSGTKTYVKQFVSDNSINAFVAVYLCLLMLTGLGVLALILLWLMGA